jgi:hypothetical protein
MAIVYTMIGGIIATCVSLGIEYCRRPKLVLSIAAAALGISRKGQHRFLHIRDTNQPLRKPIGRVLLLPASEYAVKINVAAGIVDTTRMFRLRNGDTFDDFRLVEFTPEEEKRQLRVLDARAP